MDTDLKNILGLEEPKDHNRVTIGLASAETILSWSRGEVKNPETINYRSLKPERGGLFCERIFGPSRDWECNCGRYKRMKHQGIVCDYCGVEVTRARVRRERMGHINLAAPVAHIWFSKCTPSRLGILLDMTIRDLERVIYYERWIVTDPGDTPLEVKQLLDDDHYREAKELYGDAFNAGLGAEAIEQLLKDVNLEELYGILKEQMLSTKSKANRKKIAKRMRLVEGFMFNNQRPEWMILRVLPVIPPDLRPLVPLEGGRFASSDLNDLYRRVINRNSRLRNLLNLKTPEVIIRNEKRMLQEAVDALLDNGRHGRPVTGTNNRPLKSLSDMLKGKQGRFRQNLLGKRVDYSGRSVIVVGPFLKLHQAGLPKEMALTLFEPFVMRRLKQLGYVHTVRSAKKMIERKTPVVWDVLEEVIKGHPVMLNRAPTLHRLSIQAFEPILIEGKAIRLHPLVCAAYNADFDGDQMAVHVPLSNEAQLETRLLMLAPNNIFSPANGKPITTPSQDITLGSYYLTYESPAFKRVIKAMHDNALLSDVTKHVHFTGKTFTGYYEALMAYENGVITMHEPIRIPNPDFGKEPFPLMGDRSQAKHKLLITTVGRCIFSEIWPHEQDGDIGFPNCQVGKKQLGELIKVSYDVAGRARVIRLLDDLKDLGYAYAMKSGISMAIKDMIIPDAKKDLVNKAEEEITKVRQERSAGVITDTERYNRSIDIWTECNTQLTEKLIEVLRNNNGDEKEINPIYAMLDSGARGSRDQVRQLGGMRGLMAKPNGEIIERPIIANFREGLTVLEYFISSHGARKGLADTALKTADSGYMTRKLVDAAHDVICVEDDCGTYNGITIRNILDQTGGVAVPLKDRIVGRFCVNDVISPIDGSVICEAGQEITQELARRIHDVDISEIMLRSALTCESKNGICAKCYGRHLATGNLPERGDSLGIIAAQSIGEPGTQLTMRTFHQGGTASASFKRSEIVAKFGGSLRFEDINSVKTKEGDFVVLNKNGHVVLEDAEGNEIERFDLVMGAHILKDQGAKIKAGELFVKWDAYSTPIIAKNSGKLKFSDLIEGLTMRRESNESGAEEMTVLDHREDLHPGLTVVSKKGVEESYPLPTGAHIVFVEGTMIKEGDTIAKVPRQQQKNKDITGGLPRVAELFEARRPKESAELSKIDGIIELGEVKGIRRKITVVDIETNQQVEHTVSATKRLLISNGDFVHKGQALTEGNIVPQELLDISGPRALQEYLVNQVQEVYRLQGVEINDKHIEIIVRQMMRKVRITEPGDSTKFLYGETVDRNQFIEENNRILNEGGRAAEAQPILLGITKAALETDSFISAASFQDTTRVLTEAATQGRVDYLRGFKENVIMGQLIPAGTGYHELADLKPVRHVEECEQEEVVTNEIDKAEEARQMLGL